MQVLSGLTSAGSSDDFVYPGARRAGHLVVYLSGSLSGGSVKLEAKTPNGEYREVASLGSIGDIYQAKFGPAVLRLTLSGGISPNVSAWVEFDDYATWQSLDSRAS